MTVSVVTFRKGGTRAAMTAAAQKLKAAWLKNGADSVVLSGVAAGPDSGNWSTQIVFGNWEIFGKAMQSASNDPAVADAIAGMDAIAEMVTRRIVGSVDL